MDALIENVVNQLADLYMEFTKEGTEERREFVKYRQETNDKADETVTVILETYDPYGILPIITTHWMQFTATLGGNVARARCDCSLWVAQTPIEASMEAAHEALASQHKTHLNSVIETHLKGKQP